MSLNFDSQGRLPTDPNYDGSQLGSMELYNLKLQKIVSAYTEFDAVSKAYVDSKIYDITDGLSADGILNTIKEINNYLTDNTVADGLVNQLNALQSEISAEQTRAVGVESSLSTRLDALEADATTGADVSAVQTELNDTQTGAGLDHNGSYHQSVAANYINTATNLKDADDLLDSALKTESDRAVSAEGTLTSNLNMEIFNRETGQASLQSSLASEITRATQAEEAIQNALNVVDAREVANRESADADRLAIRNDFASADGVVQADLDAHKASQEGVNSNADNERVRIEGDLDAQKIKQAGEHQANVDRLDAHDGDISGLAADIFTEQSNRQNADTAISDELNIQKGKQNSEHNENVGRLDGHDGDIQDLQNDKFDKVGGEVSGDAQFESNVGFNIQHGTVDEYANGNGKFLYFSQRWRMYGKSDGSRLVFEYNSGSQENANWKPAVPFISSI
jgi:hypothetical protein